MNSDQFAKYHEHLDHPQQLPLGRNVPSLYRLYQEHLTRFPYQNVELFLNQPIRDLSVAGLLDSVPKSGGYCFHQSELMLFALQHLGFQVERVAAWVLMGNQFQEGMPLNHNILVVKVSDDEMFLCDPGLASASPRFPLKFKMNATEEITISQGDKYKLEVQDGYYQLYWWMKDSWLLMYRFQRDASTGLPKTSNQDETHELCKAVHEGPGFIPIRDKYVKISIQTNDSKIDFMFIEGVYNYKKFNKGRPIESKTLDNTEFFQMVKKLCNLEFDVTELPKK